MAKDAGLHGVEVGLGQPGAYESAVKKQEVETEELKPKPEPVKVEPPKPEPVKVEPPKPEPVKAEPPKPEPVKVEPPKPEPVKVEPPKPEPVKAEPPKPEPKPEPVTPVKEAVKAPVEEAADKEVKTESTVTQKAVKATGQANHQATGGKVGDPKSYFTALVRELNRYKVYPRQLKRRKIEGVVTVKFTVQSNGQISSAEIQTSSGHRALDKAAMEIFEQATLPPIPTFMNRDSLTISVPIHYSLIKD